MKAFRRCDVKTVSFSRRLKTADSTGLIIDESDRDPAKNYTLNGYRATLNCPRTVDDNIVLQSDRQNHSTQLEALNNLTRLAGSLLCEQCRYANMTPVEVSVARTDLAVAEAARVQAYEALRQARAEIEHL